MCHKNKHVCSLKTQAISTIGNEQCLFKYRQDILQILGTDWPYSRIFVPILELSILLRQPEVIPFLYLAL